MNYDQKLEFMKRQIQYRMNDLKNVPAWNYDGSSTFQTSGENSEINLLPVSVYRNPLFKHRNSGLESLTMSM